MKRFATVLGLAVLLVARNGLAGGGGGDKGKSLSSRKCSYFVPDKVVSGDEWYGPGNFNWCNDSFLANLANNYGMNGDEWEGGWGWTDACNSDKPFARVAAAKIALFQSSPNPKLSGDSFNFNDPFLDWAGRYASVIIDELDPSCGFGTTAIASYVDLVVDSYIVLNLFTLHDGNIVDQTFGFFFGQDVPARASILLHEARHWDGGPDHNDDEKDETFGGGGSYGWQASWLATYAQSATNAPVELKCSAQCLANALLDQKFVQEPGHGVRSAVGIHVAGSLHVSGSRVRRWPLE